MFIDFNLLKSFLYWASLLINNTKLHSPCCTLYTAHPVCTLYLHLSLCVHCSHTLPVCTLYTYTSYTRHIRTKPHIYLFFKRSIFICLHYSAENTYKKVKNLFGGPILKSKLIVKNMFYFMCLVYGIKLSIL